MARFGVPSQGRDPLAYVDNRLSGMPTKDGNRDPTIYDRDYPIQTIWRNNNTFKEWILVGFTSGDAIWRPFADGEGAILELEADDGNIVQPDSGLITVIGTTVANAANSKPVFTDGSTDNTLGIETQISTTVSPTPAVNTNVGLSCYNINQFDIDAASGMVSLKGGVQNSPILGILLDDSLEASANATGTVDMTGSLVANSTNAKPLFTSRNPAGNDVDLQIQLSTASAASDENLAGLCYFDDGQFSVDVKGKVTLAGGGAAIDAFSTDAAGPVSPDGTGTVDVTGTSVFSDGTVANTLTLNVQASANTLLYGAGANTTVSELGPLTDGQLVIGSTGNAPVASTLTAGTNISISNGPGSITISSTDTFNSVGTFNVGIKYSSPTFSVTSADGSALSASNPAYISIYSRANPGRVITVQVTADQTFVDDSGGSTINGNLFGFLAADTTASDDVPFFIYAVLNDAEDAISFMISRQQARRKSPAAADIGKTGSAVGDNAWSFFALGDPTIADYDENPCLPIGCFKMRLTTAGGDWTVQSLDQEDGIGQFFEQKIFYLPVNILGASANTHWLDNGGTAPVLNTPYLSYRLLRNGDIQVNYQCGNTSSAGVGAVRARCIVPFPAANTSPGSDQADAILCGEINEAAGTKIICIGSVETGNYMQYVQINNGGSGGLLNTDFAIGVGEYQFGGNYTPRFA